MAIDDFGKKIGGARKDLWRQRGLDISDILEFNDAERDKHIIKDNVWKRPDYQELVNSGIPVRVVYFMKMMRDAIPTKPVYSSRDAESIRDRQEGYITFVGNLRDAVMGLRSEEEVLGFYENYLKKNYIEEKPGRYYVNVLPGAYGCIDNKMLRAADVKNFRDIDRSIRKKQFCYSEEDKIKAMEQAFLKQFDVFIFDKEYVSFEKDYSGRDMMKISQGWRMMYLYPEGEDANPESYVEGKVCIVRNGKIIAKNMDSPEEADAFLKEMFRKTQEKSNSRGPSEAKTKKKRKTPFVPIQLEHIEREGEDYRHGRSARGDDYMDLFGFSGGEFGVWMNEKDRQASLDFGMDALLDMCRAIDIDPNDISLGNRLSIAFGSRGVAGAAAHYEPLREVINLTKMKGAGSLAHEWAHSLDDIVGKSLGLSGFMTENIHKDVVPESLRTLMKTMKYKNTCDSATKERQTAEADDYALSIREAVRSYFPESRMDESQKNRLDKLLEELTSSASDCGNLIYNYIYRGYGYPQLDEISDFRKELTGRVIQKDDRIKIAHWQNFLRTKIEAIGTSVREDTDFYRNSKFFDSLHSKTDHGYWQSDIEMFARAFACYVSDRVEGKSDYLCGHSDVHMDYYYNPKTKENELIRAFPFGEERERINQCFDAFFEELREKGILHEFDDSRIDEIFPEPKRFSALDDMITDAKNIRLSSEKKDSGLDQLAFDFDFEPEL